MDAWPNQCPWCAGFGRVPDDTSTSVLAYRQCGACGGKGVLNIMGDELPPKEFLGINWTGSILQPI